MAEDVKIILRTEAQGNGAQTTEEGLNRVTNAGKRAAETVQKVTSGPAPKAPKAKSEPEFDPNRPAPKIIDTWAPLPKSASAATAPAKPTFSKEQVEQGMENARARAKRDEEAIAAAQQKEDAPSDPKSPKNRSRQINLAKAAALEIALAQAKAGGDQDEIAGAEKNLRVHKLAMRFKREQGVSSEEALEKAGTLVGAQTVAKQRAADEKAAVKERIAGEREVNRELQNQENTRRRMLVKLGGAAATGAVAIGGELLTDYFERAGIENRDKAARAMNARQLQIQSGVRGTSGQVQGEAWAAQDRLAALEANTPEVERKAKQGIWETALKRGAQGAAGGAAVGALGAGIGAIPGSIVGGGIGVAAGALEGWLSSDRSISENDKAKALERKKAQDAQQLATKKALEEETGLEIDAIHQRSKRTLSGIRAAQVDDLARVGMQKYRQLRNAGVPENEAKEAAMESTATDLRNKQIAAASGLVDARSGAGDIAAAARWSKEAMPSEQESARLLGQKIDSLHDTTKQGVIQQGLVDFGK